jgi:anti-sigma B factor antagonist
MGIADEDFTVDVRREGEHARVALTGELDIATVPRLAQVMREHDEAATVLLDLSALRFLDTSGLRAVIEEDQRATADGRRLQIVRGPAAVQRVFALAGVEDRLPFVSEES